MTAAYLNGTVHPISTFHRIVSLNSVMNDTLCKCCSKIVSTNLGEFDFSGVVCRVVVVCQESNSCSCTGDRHVQEVNAALTNVKIYRGLRSPEAELPCRRMQDYKGGRDTPTTDSGPILGGV